MIQKIDIYEEFDARVEKFLRKLMTEDEEQQFKDELAADSDKMLRARAMALMASQMKDIRREQEVATVQQMVSMSETEFRKAIGMQNAELNEMQNAECRMQNWNNSECRMQNSELSGAADDSAFSIQNSALNEAQPNSAFRIQNSALNEAQPNSEFRILHSALIRRISIAASMIGILTIGGIQYNAYNRTTALGNTYYNLVSSDISNQRGDLDAQNMADMQKLFDEVAKGEKLEETIASLGKLYEITSNYAQPNSEFRILHSALTPFRQTIAWNLALAHLKDGNRNAAKKVLSTIVAENDPDKAITQSANKLISEIADIPSLW